MQDVIEAYPLTWPGGWPRAKEREKSQFKTTQDKAQRRLLHEIELLGGESPVISTNVPLRQDGMPYARYGKVGDVGVAVYFKLKGRPMVFACDRFELIGENVHAIGLTIGALRGIDRWGASQMMERAFTGFTALPPAMEMPAVSKPWWEVLEVERGASLEVCRAARNRLALKHHPDMASGFQKNPTAKIAEINVAFAECEKEKS